MKDILILLFHSKRFIAGFILFLSVLLFALIGPVLNPKNPFQMVGGLFSPPSDEFL
ncbi:MAG: ABC transporter permease, partial [bacterium]